MNQTSNVGTVSPPKIEFKWTIENFRRHLDESKPGHALVSPAFAQNWHVYLYPRGSAEATSDFLAVYLAHTNPFDVRASARLSLLCASDRAANKLRLREQLFKRDEPLGSDRFAEVEAVSSDEHYLRDGGSLVVSCELRIVGEVARDPRLHRMEALQRWLLEFNDFEKLLNSDRFSNVTFIVGGKRIFAHKNVLYARSPVFQEMFQLDADVNTRHAVEIEDFAYEHFMEFLRYLYTGTFARTDDIAQHLLPAAERYRVKGLKAACEEILCCNIRDDNFVEYLELAHANSAEVLKARVIGFIKVHVKDIVGLQSFEKFGKLDAALICEVFREIAR